MTQQHQNKRNRPTPLPRRGTRKPPALDFMQLTSDAVTLLRYAKTIQVELLALTPDEQVHVDLEESLAKCGDAMSALMKARQNALTRYTPSGAHKSPSHTHS